MGDLANEPAKKPTPTRHYYIYTRNAEENLVCAGSAVARSPQEALRLYATEQGEYFEADTYYVIPDGAIHEYKASARVETRLTLA